MNLYLSGEPSTVKPHVALVGEDLNHAGTVPTIFCADTKRDPACRSLKEHRTTARKCVAYELLKCAAALRVVQCLRPHNNYSSDAPAKQQGLPSPWPCRSIRDIPKVALTLFKSPETRFLPEYRLPRSRA